MASPLSMDQLGDFDQNDYMYVVVQASEPYIANTTTKYNEARKLRISSEFESVILAIKPETMQAINNGELREIIL